jgi:NAD+ kinase
VRLADHEYFRVLGEKLGWGLPHVAKPGTLPLAS